MDDTGERDPAQAFGPDRQPDFRHFYNHTIHPELMRMEKKRRRMMMLIFICGLLLAGVVVLQGWLGILALSLSLLIPIGFYMAYLIYLGNKQRLAFKPKIIRLVLDFIDDALGFDDLTYEAQRKIPLGDFLASRLFDVQPAIYEGEDFIAGWAGDVQFELCELRVESNSRIRERLEEDFKGIFMHCLHPAPLEGELLVLPKNVRADASQAIRNFTFSGGRNADALISNTDFLRYFTVYTSTGVSREQHNTLVRRFLPGKIQGEMVRHVAGNGQGPFFFLFCEGHFFCFIQPHDILEPPVFQSVVSFDLIMEFYQDIYRVLRIIQTFDRYF